MKIGGGLICLVQTIAAAQAAWASGRKSSFKRLLAEAETTLHAVMQAVDKADS